MTNQEFIESIAIEGEEWRDVVGYEGYYMVSSLGRIVSLGRVIHRIKRTTCYKPRILKPYTIGNGYKGIVLCNSIEHKKFYVHRIIAEAFIPNPNMLKEIDHINTIRNDNRVENLRWCSRKGNMNNPLSRENVRNALLGKLNNHSSKPIVQLKEETLIATFPSIAEAGRTGYDTSCICDVLNGSKKLYRGCSWMYLHDYETQVSMSKNSNIPRED